MQPPSPPDPVFIMVAKVWPGLVAVIALVLSVVGWLNANGFIDPVAHRNDVSTINAKISDIDKLMAENKADHKEMMIDIRKAVSSLAKIEGKLDMRSKFK